MVFIGGPRQVEKTTLVKALLNESLPKGLCLNWNFDEDRQEILKKRWGSDNTLLLFDELYKFPRWKSWIKCLYDVGHETHTFLVTGSARLDLYRKGGDSLMGRYHNWR
jgi:predicted AAA+ superfamily ATPase